MSKIANNDTIQAIQSLEQDIVAYRNTKEIFSDLGLTKVAHSIASSFDDIKHNRVYPIDSLWGKL